ncbi:MAG: DNA polymerase I [Minisyncoccia bacterium]
MKKFVIVDSYALAHRAYHALPPLVSPEGKLVNAVYGFLLVFLKMIDILKPDYLVAAFDLAKPTFRHLEYKEYKAQRVKAPDNFYEQIGVLKNILNTWGIPIIAQESYEADDIIGSLVNKFYHEDLEFIIVTGDLDTLQLVNDKTKIYTFKKGLQDVVIYDEKAIKEKYDLIPKQLIDFKALKGDPSDNIPGVPSVGEKTAIKLIKEFGSLDNLYEALESNKKITSLSEKLKKTLLENKDQAYFSRHLSLIDTTIPLDYSLEDLRYHEPPLDKIAPLFKTLGFNSLLNRLTSKPLTTPEIKVNLNYINNNEDLDEVIKKINSSLKYGLYLDYNGKKIYERQINGLYIILPHGVYFLEEKKLNDFKKKINQINFKIPGYTLGLKNLIEEIEEVKNLDLKDLEILSWLIDSERKNYELSSLVKFFLKKTFNEKLNYLQEIINLGEEIENKVQSLNLKHLWETIEKPLIPVLVSMEKNGIFADSQELDELSKEAEDEIQKLASEIYHLAQKTFNINSYQKLAEVLFTDLKLDINKVRKTASGIPSTDINELEKIKNDHPIVPKIIEYRQLEKMLNSFLIPLPQFINPLTKRIHTIWKQTGTSTGRLSSEEPNLQNIPLKGEWGKKIRHAFKAQEGFQFLSLDYSQIELRIAAHLSQDSKLIEAFKSDKDIHTLTASYLKNIKESEVTPELRRLAKIINFGILYGIGDKSLSESANISLKEAKAFKEKYFEEFSGLKMYLDNTLKQAKELGYSQTILGRKRILPLIGSLGQIGREEERMAINMPIQGLASDIIKLAMINCFNFIKENNYENKVRLILQIHDELIFEVKTEIIKEVLPQLIDIMDHAYLLIVPLKTNSAIGDNWGDLD